MELKTIAVPVGSFGAFSIRRLALETWGIGMEFGDNIVRLGV